ncbi:chorismate-binding protein [Salinivibrio sp. ML323]|uniref:chromate efflux transporter n=1 Tax=unclassified Salinivibrio TaxID=2636825 RepID=UPI000984FF2C|nr:MULTISPECIES: chromate efflux transporter [unclassified Salinivibrio]OOE56824.1 chorismate-binding protein [Salinivibrio sp. ML323]OOE63504.1 chorismate-binding protein [Salinivibrio sp. IB282]
MIELIKQFFLLGCMSFGGPAAHVGYFERVFVKNKRWLSEETFASGLAISQFLPGPGSSQLGMYIGYQRAGYIGALGAFVAFTLPSFALLTAAAVLNSGAQAADWVATIISAAKLLAVVVVIDATVSMGKKFVSSWATASIAVMTTLWLLFTPSGVLYQVLPILIAGIVGAIGFAKPQQRQAPVTIAWRRSGTIIGLFLLLLTVPWLFNQTLWVQVFNLFYQAGSFVFGGGHVVLPLLEPIVGDVVTDSALIEGYAAAQLVPGPMFTMASYLGASIDGLSPLWGSIIATIAIFLPGALLMFGVLPVWDAVKTQPRLAGAISLINACVVGLLAAALYQPVWVSAYTQPLDLLPIALGLVALIRWRVSVFWLLLLMMIYQFTIA